MTQTPPKQKPPHHIEERPFTFRITPWLSLTVSAFTEDSARHSLLRYGAADISKRLKEEKQNATKKQ